MIPLRIFAGKGKMKVRGGRSPSSHLPPRASCFLIINYFLLELRCISRVVNSMVELS